MITINLEGKNTLQLPSTAKEVNWKDARTFIADCGEAKFSKLVRKDTFKHKREYLASILKALQTFISIYNAGFDIKQLFKINDAESELKELLKDEEVYNTVHTYIFADDSIYSYLMDLVKNPTNTIKIEKEEVRFTIEGNDYFIPLSYIDIVYRRRQRTDVATENIIDGLSINAMLNELRGDDIALKAIALCAQKRGNEFQFAGLNLSKADKKAIAESKIEQFEKIDWATLKSIDDFIKIFTNK
ncbi:MAG: hypothetical protein AAFO82_00145 [Bacteroidota bacterium]